MARYNPDEVEADEVYHSLLERKTMLEKRAKDLEEKDGLPEAAQSVRGRIELYNPSGDGDEKRPGLIRLFAPQRDIEAEAASARRDQESDRDASGGQDLFGGGAETGGGHPPGQVEPAPAKAEQPEGKKRGGRKKTKEGKEGGAGEEVVAEYEIVDESHRLTAGAGAPGNAAEIEAALAQLDQLGKDLVVSDAAISTDMFQMYAGHVISLIPVINPRIDRDGMVRQILEEFASSDENAHILGYYVQRAVDAARDAFEKPIGADHGGAEQRLEASNLSTGGANAAGSDASSLNFGSSGSDASEDSTAAQPSGAAATGEASDAAPAPSDDLVGSS